MARMAGPVVYNLSGRPIAENAAIAIAGQPRPGFNLVIEAFDGTNGIANWRSDAELKALILRQQQARAEANARPAWAPPLKPGAPYG